MLLIMLRALEVTSLIIIIIINIISLTLLIPQTVKNNNRIDDLVCTVRSQ